MNARRFVAGILLFSVSLSAAELRLTKVVSREDPLCNVREEYLSLGLDGKVYLSSGKYVLRLNRDGTGKFGRETIYAQNSVAANAQGLVATANGHFDHSINLWDTGLLQIGKVPDFLNSDATNWSGPCQVVVGDSGDFYGVDQNRDRILRIRAPNRVVTSYPLQNTGESFVKSELWLKVWEKGERFHIRSRSGTIHALGFDGKKAWSLPKQSHVFDVDAQGRLHVHNHGGSIQIFGVDGKEAGKLESKSYNDIRRFCLWGDEIVIKHNSESEHFRVYSRKTGELIHTVAAEVERISVTSASDLWTAGERVPLGIEFAGLRAGHQPVWRAWLRPYQAPDFTPLPVQDGTVMVPADAAGLCKLKVTSGADASDSEYAVQGWVLVAARDARGSATVLTPGGRVYWGWGEEIPVSVHLRIANGERPKQVGLRLRREGGERVVMDFEIPVPGDGPAGGALTADLVRALRPGAYRLSVEVEGLTCVPQRLEIGSGIAERPRFHIVEHGDYSARLPIKADLWDSPEVVARFLARSRVLGIDMFVDRIGASGAGHKYWLTWNNHNGGTGQMAELEKRVEAQPTVMAKEAVRGDSPYQQALSAIGAHGIELRGILLTMDAGLPLGTLWDNRKPERMDKDLTEATGAVKDYPGFTGWNWAANWWFDGKRQYANAARDEAQKKAYEAALKAARETGRWDPVLDEVNAVWMNYPLDAERRFNGILQKLAPGKTSGITGPYRAVGIDPPLTYRNADEIDLQYQAEQIQPPQVTPHNIDFSRRPGKRAYAHPEIFNDDGTGGMILPTELQLVMRGADGVGWSGDVPVWGPGTADVRNAGPGIVSVVRAFTKLVKPYGPWSTTLRNEDPIAIPVSHRMMGIDSWGAIGGVYFTRLYEAYNACLYAHRPARFVFALDATPDSFKGFKAVLLVGQTVELDPALRVALDEAGKAGIPIYRDQTCREEMVKSYKPLGLGFDCVQKGGEAWQDDSAYARIPGYFVEHAKALNEILKGVPPIAELGNPEVLLSERREGEGRFIWVVNNTMLPLGPDLAWRICLIMSQRMPVFEKARLSGATPAVYEAFIRQRIHPDGGKVAVDLRTMPARLFAILPAAIESVQITGPKSAKAGDSFTCPISVVDGQGRPIACSIPLRVRLLSASGTSLEERYTATALEADLKKPFVAPRDYVDGKIVVEVQELLGGTTGRCEIPMEAVDVKPAVKGTARAQEAPWDDLPSSSFGTHLKDIALSADGKTALLNAMNWDHNLYLLNMDDGSVRFSKKVGHHFTYGPVRAGEGFAIQAFDLNTAEGYHLYLLNARDAIERRFALYGLPKRATSWAHAPNLPDPINNFAISPNGDWVASAGDLGLVVWDRSGRLLWSQDWWKTNERFRVKLLAAGADLLVVMHGMVATAYQSQNGKQVWQLNLAPTGDLQGGVVSADGKTLALWSTANGGRIHVIRDGKRVNALFAAAEDVSISADGQSLAAVTERGLRWFRTDGTLVWNFEGNDRMRWPRISPDGSRVTASTELGTLYVLDATGKRLHERDFGSLPVAHWLSDGDLFVATWMGQVCRLDGKNFVEKWRWRPIALTVLDRTKLVEPDTTPTARLTGWGNAAADPAPLTPNLLKETKALIRAVFEPTAHGDPRKWQNPIELLTDGKPDAPPEPWLDWNDINYIDSGWRKKLTLQFDTFRTQLRLEGITFIEDPAHPESWLRDVRVQYWHEESQQWVNGPLLLSNRAAHTHRFAKPLEAAKFRLVSTGGATWPAGNVRLGEVVFHGQVLGASHPDVVARRDVAVLFDEEDKSFRESMIHGHNPDLSIKAAGRETFSGGHILLLGHTRKGTAGPNYRPPFGHAIPNWDFEIAEDPKPGQYRWLQFAWKAGSAETTGMGLLVGHPWPGTHLAVTCGDYQWENAHAIRGTKKMEGKPPLEWQVVQVDLWALAKPKDAGRIQCLAVGTKGGPAQFDRIVLGRTKDGLAGR